MDQPEANNAILASWNCLDPAAAAEVLLPCNGSLAWALGVAGRAPFASPKQIFAASDEVWHGLSARDWQQAFDSHPRIGETHAQAATARSLAWSASEQSTAASNTNTAAALAAANRAYEANFGRIFILCATGKTADEILANLQQRLENDSAAEWAEAAEQQRQITQLRLRKWLALEASATSAVS